MDDQVKFRGYRIELGEIERVMEQERWIREAVVVMREDTPGDKRLVGYVVVEGEKEEEIKGLRKRLKEKLPDYMAPSAIVVVEKMPLTANGKLDRKALPRPKREDGEAGYAAPRTAVEEMLAGIFGEALKLDRVSIHDNFFEIGGHSLLATHVISQVREAFGIEIGVSSIFETATVAELAEVLIAGEPKPGQTEKIALILKKLDSMTEEDAGAELAALDR
jgi:acyl carrier protein